MFDGCFYRKTKDDNEATTNVEAHDNLFEVGNDVDYDSDASVEFL